MLNHCSVGLDECVSNLIPFNKMLTPTLTPKQNLGVVKIRLPNVLKVLRL